MKTEDTWSTSNAWCPQPEWWHAQDEQATEVEVIELVAAFVRALQPEVVVEAGTWTGQATKAMAVSLALNRHGHLYAVESDERLAAQALMFCGDLPVTVTVGDSLTWEPPSGIGFAWVDGAVRQDLEVEHLLDYMLPGAIIGMHDTGPFHARDRRAWLEACPRLSSITLHTPRGVSFAAVK